MPEVAALYRYPIKGFTPEEREELVLAGDGRIVGDRVLSFRFPRGTKPRDQEGLDYWPKGDGLCLRDFPALALLRLKYLDGVVRLEAPQGLLVEADAISDAGVIVQAVLDFLAQTDATNRISQPGHLPLELVGDGVTARFQDRAKGYVSVHSRSSLAELSTAVGIDLDDRRFRSNVAVSGWQPWTEAHLIGRRMRIGEVIFEVDAPITRCLATHANPDSGVRDAAVMTTLTRKIGLDKPAFGILLLPAPGQEGAAIRVGDPVVVLDGSRLGS